MFGRRNYYICPLTKKTHKFDPVTHQCQCGRYQRGFTPKKEPTKPRDECQICERQQAMDINGRMGHHGYKRPGIGFIEGDCMGVGHKPYKATDALEKYLKVLKEHLKSCRASLKALPTVETLPFMYHTGCIRERQTHGVQIKRGTEGRYDPELRVSFPSFDTLQRIEQDRLTIRIEHLGHEIDRVNARIQAAKESPTGA